MQTVAVSDHHPAECPTEIRPEGSASSAKTLASFSWYCVRITLQEIFIQNIQWSSEADPFVGRNEVVCYQLSGDQ